MSFIRNLDRAAGATMIFIVEEAKKKKCKSIAIFFCFNMTLI